MFSRRHYETLARVILESMNADRETIAASENPLDTYGMRCILEGKRRLTMAIIGALELDNPRFDVGRFLEAAGVTTLAERSQ